MDEQARADRRQMACEHRRALAELDEKRQQLSQRSRHLDERRAALARLKSELDQTHRQTLTIREATEELWLKLARHASPATLDRSLSHLKDQLAARYRAAESELAERKQELDSIRAELSNHLRMLADRKRQLEDWARQKEEEFQRPEHALAPGQAAETVVSAAGPSA
jgi:prefoldin subunit 5